MRHNSRSGIAGLSVLLLALPALAEGYEVEWSASIEAVLKHFEDSVDDDEVTGFFDRYEFTSGKSAGMPVQLALSDLDLDVPGAEETPLLQFRFRENAAPTFDVTITADPVNFISDTDRVTGKARIQRRFGEPAVIHGGFQGASLEQVGDHTSRQRTD